MAGLIPATTALPQSPLLYSWGPNQGLVQYSVSSIAQDEHGYIWLGAESGVSRFNGREFETYDNRNGFVNEAVRSIVVGAEETYFLTEDGELYTAVPAGAQRVETNRRVLALVRAPEGETPWMITTEGLRRGLGKDLEKLPFELTHLDLEAPPAAVYDDTVFIAAGDEVFRLGDGVTRVLRLDQPIEALLPIPGRGLGIVTRNSILAYEPARAVLDEVWKTDDLILSCGASGHGRIAIGTTSGAIVVLEGNDVEVLEHGLPRQAVMAVLIDRENNIWAGLDSGGVILLPVSAFTSFTSADGVGTGDAFYMVADHVRGGVWVGTRNGGIAHISDSTVTSIDSNSGLPSDRVRALHQSADGTLFVGTAAGIFVYELSGRSWVHATREESFFQFFYEEPGGSVFAGSRDGRLLRWQGGRSFQRVDTSDIPGELALTAMIAYEGRFYLGTSRGVYVTDAIGQGFEGPLAGEAQVREMLIDGEGRLWVATVDQGAWMAEGGTWRNFGSQQGFDTQVRFVVTDPEGRPWFGGSGGIWSFPDPEATRINTARGLSSDNIFLLRFDPQGQLWVGHNVGLDLIRNDRVVASFDNRDGLADNELNANGFAVDEKGRLWFCTMKGASRIDPAALSRKRVNPLIHLQGIEVNDVRLGVEHSASGLAPVQLAHDHNSLRFRFSGQSFVDPTGIRYLYRLEGLDDDWSRPETVGWASYPKLRPGSYTFRVRCLSSDGLESPIDEVKVEIVPALWQRTSFRLAVAFVILGGIFGAMVLRHRRILARSLELEQIVEERTRDLAEANEELRRLSITDPLTGLFNRRFFEEEIQSELATALRAYRNALDDRRDASSNSFLSMFMLDLDHFKTINDQHGHEAGDRVLRDFSAVVRKEIRSSDTLFRWGGEEFLLLARNTDPGSTQILAERIRVAVAAHRCRCDESEIAVTCSIGFVPFPFHIGEPGRVEWSDLVHLADQALYLAKEWGRNAWVGISPSPQLVESGGFDEVLRDLRSAHEAGLVILESNRPGKGDLR